jgi:transcriptional regulator GlxA family with amidase domain
MYEHAEVLDFSGPFEVFSTAKRISDLSWQIFTIAETTNVVSARGDFQVLPHYSIDNHPKIDLLIVVGGDHTAELNKPNIIKWIASTAKSCQLVASVCTGAFLLAKAGLLNGKNVTTHWQDIEDLRQQFPQLNVMENQRWVTDGLYTTSGGISAGIDMSLQLVSVIGDNTLANNTAKQMEYGWQDQ